MIATNSVIAINSSITANPVIAAFRTYVCGQSTHDCEDTVPNE